MPRNALIHPAILALAMDHSLFKRPKQILVGDHVSTQTTNHMPRKSFDPLKDPGPPENLAWTIFYSKGPSRFWFKIRSPQKGPITMPRNALIFLAILANRSPRRLDQSANCTVLYKVSPWLWEVVGAQSQGSSSFKRISAKPCNILDAKGYILKCYVSHAFRSA